MEEDEDNIPLRQIRYILGLGLLFQSIILWRVFLFSYEAHRQLLADTIDILCPNSDLSTTIL